MKPVGLISTGVLLLLGSIAPLYAQQEQDTKPPKQEEKAKPEQQNKGKQQDPNKQQQQRAQQQQKDQGKQEQQHAQKQQQDQNKQQRQRAQQQQKEQGKQEQQRAQKQQQDQNKQQQQQRQQQVNRPSEQKQRGRQREVWQPHRAQNWQSEHRDWRQRGGYNGYRIPEDRYRGHFGPDHRFRIYRYPVEVYGGFPRFQYGGFWFGFMDPWPEYWSDDWYDSDDVYIDYTDDGYYLYNRRYPRDRIAITVYLN
jgi:hypothetical protein